MATVINKVVTEGTHLAGETASKVAMTTGAVVGGVGLAAVTGTLISQLEYRGQKEELRELYRKEIATKLGKSEKDVTMEDLEFLGETNRTISGQLRKAKKERTLGIGTISVATLASVGVAIGIKGMLGIGAATAGAGFGALVLPWLATTAIAMLAYVAIKAPIQNAAEKVFGVDKKTTHERIEKIQKDHEAGKVISNERVFAVFAHANPEIDQYIKAQYGKEFDQLKVADKMTVAGTLGTRLGVAQITDDINQGRMQATELAFTVDGDYSGVLPTLGDEPKTGIVGKVKETIQHAAEVVTGHPAPEQKPGISFVQREMARRALAAQMQQTTQR